MSDRIVDKLILLYETQGADKANKELQQAQQEADSTATAYDDLAKASDRLGRNIESLSEKRDKASKKEAGGISKGIDSLRKQLSTSQTEQAVAKQKAQDAKGQFNTLTKKQKEADKSAGVLADKNKKLLNGFVALGAKVGLVAAPLAIFKKTLDGTMEFERGGQALRLMGAFSGADPQKIQALGNALKSHGGDAASASAMVGGLNAQLQELRMTGSSQLWEAARRYGMDFTGTGEQGLATVDELLEKIAIRMDTLNEQEQLDFGRQLGLDSPTIMMLQGGLSGFTESLKAAESLSLFTDADLQLAKDYNETVIGLTASLSQLKAVMFRQTAPLTKKLMEDVKVEMDNFSKGTPEKSSLNDLRPGAKLWQILNRSEETKDALNRGGKALKSTKTPISSQTSTSINNNKSSGGDLSVSVQELTIHTQATDAEGIAGGIVQGMDNQFKIILNQTYSGALA